MLIDIVNAKQEVMNKRSYKRIEKFFDGDYMTIIKFSLKPDITPDFYERYVCFAKPSWFWETTGKDVVQVKTIKDVKEVLNYLNRLDDVPLEIFEYFFRRSIKSCLEINKHRYLSILSYYMTDDGKWSDVPDEYGLHLKWNKEYDRFINEHFWLSSLFLYIDSYKGSAGPGPRGYQGNPIQNDLYEISYEHKNRFPNLIDKMVETSFP